MRTKLTIIRNISFLFAATIFLFGCVASKLTTQELHSVKNQNPPDGKALIYIVRPSSYFGAAIKFKVACDNVSIGSTMGGQFIYSFVEPGKVQIISAAENDAKLFLITEPNKTYYIEQVVQMGLIVARNKLVRLNDIKGKVALNKCKLSVDCPAYENRNLMVTDVIKTDTAKNEKLNKNSLKNLEIKGDTSSEASQDIKSKKIEPNATDGKITEASLAANELFNADKYYLDKNYTQAFKILKAYKDDPSFTSEHMNTLGKMHFLAQGTLVNYPQAKDCFTKAAEKGNAKSMYNLGIMYYEGKGGEKDNAKAYEWFKKSADLGNVNAMNNLAEMEKNGLGITK
jgi:hypothetical protein